jgi:peptide/nickel transport system substrate-binding protein
MNEQSKTLRIATVLGLFAFTIAMTMNTCAMGRLEEQVIMTRQAVEQRTGGTARVVGAAHSPGAATSEAGSGTGIVAQGWGGNSAEILHVSGAKPGAPVSLDDKPKPQGDTYVQRQSGAPGTLNYYVTNDGLTRRIAKNSLEGMITINPENPSELWPQLATSWEVSDDKLVYTYTLREGVLFADGRPFTSSDVVFTFETMRDPAVKAEHMRGSFEDVESVEANGTHSIVVRYRNKDWRGLTAIGYHLYVLNKGWYEEQIPVYAKRLDIDEFATAPGSPGFGEVFNKIRVPCPGTGPYYMADLVYDSEKDLELVQNPFWWGIQVHPGWHNFHSLKTIFIDDDVGAFQEFRKGHFDVMVVDAAAWDDEYSKDELLLKTTNFYSYDHMGIGFSHITWNNREPPFDDPRVRRAMAHMIDREWILKEVNRGRGSVGACFGKPSYPICQTPGLVPLKYDLDKAKALLAEAGWTDSDGDGILDKEGQRFEFEVKVGSPRTFYTQVGGLMSDSAAKIGIRATLRTLEWSTFLNDYMEDNFDAAILYASFADPWIDPRESNHSSADVPRGGNRAGWRNAEADVLMDTMIEEFDAQKRLEAYWAFNAIYQREQPRTHLVHGLVSVLQNNRFEDVKVLPTGLRPNEYWVKPENVKYK